MPTSLGFIDDEGDAQAGSGVTIVESELVSLAGLVLSLKDRVERLERREPGQVPQPSSRRTLDASACKKYEEEVRRIRDGKRNNYRERLVNVFDLPANED